MQTPYHGRYAPTPSGPLHVGNALAAAIAWSRARTAGGRFSLRIEDLDTPRIVPDAEAAQCEDLLWLGLEWDGPLVRQSERLAHYWRAVEALFAAGRAYYCTCSRKQVALASAPHGPSDEGPRYPGTCRGRTRPPETGEYAVRFHCAPGIVTIDDALSGRFSQDVQQSVGDFVIARKDGVIAYQLAVVVDDIAMGITEVVRGGDLLYSSPRQAQLYAALGAPLPGFAHTPLVLAADGQKLSKRDPRHTLAGLRGQGVSGPALRDACIRRAGAGPTILLSDLLGDLAGA